MPDNKRYKVSFPLYGAIDPAGCEYKVLTTKIELKLKKGSAPLSACPWSSSAFGGDGRNHVRIDILTILV